MFNLNLLVLKVVVLCILICPKFSQAQALFPLTKTQIDTGPVLDSDILSAEVSANGRYIAFATRASNVVSGDTNYATDLFIKDINTGEVTRVNTTDNGSEMDEGVLFSFSKPTSDGRYIAFVAKAINFPDYNRSFNRLYLKDLQTGSLKSEGVFNGNQLIDISGFNQLYLSDNGQFITFLAKSDVLEIDQNDKDDVYRKDLQTGAYELVSVATTGQSSETSSIRDAYLVGSSDSGRYTLFLSNGRDIVSQPNNLNTRNNVYLRDNQLQVTQFVNVDENGFPSSASNSNSNTSISAAVSDNGDVVFCSSIDDLVSDDNNDLADVFYFDGSTNTRISLNESSGEITDGDCLVGHNALGSAFKYNGVDISANGERVTFIHESDVLVNLDDNETSDVFMYDVNSGNTSLISANDSGVVGDAESKHVTLSSTGQQLTFLSKANNLNDNVQGSINHKIFRYVTTTGNMNWENVVAENPMGLLRNASTPRMSSDQKWILFASESNNLEADTAGDFSGNLDLYLLNRDSGLYVQVGDKVSSSSNVSFGANSGFKQTNRVNNNTYDISANGHYVVFSSAWFQPISTLPLDDDYLFIYDTQTGLHTQLITGANRPRVNNDGNVVFSSNRDDLVPNDNNQANDVFIYNFNLQTFSRISEAVNGQDSNGESIEVDIVGSGIDTWVVFKSFADNLINDDLNGFQDIFYRNWPNGQIMRASQNLNGTGVDSPATFMPVMSENSEKIIFSSNATNLTVEGNPDSTRLLFIYDRFSQNINLVSKNINEQPVSALLIFLSAEYDISDSGRYVSYHSSENLIVNDDFDEMVDIFLYDVEDEVSIRVSELNPKVSYDLELVEDLSVSPPLLGLSYLGSMQLVNDHNPNLNLFLYQDYGPGVNLSMQVIGQGNVSGSLAYFCDGSCTDTYEIGTDLFLAASPAIGFTFDGWSGDACAGEGQSCQLSVDQNLEVRAIFIDPNDIIFESGFE